MSVPGNDQCRLSLHREVYIVRVIGIDRVYVYYRNSFDPLRVLRKILDKAFNSFGGHTESRFKLLRELSYFLNDVLANKEKQAPFSRVRDASRGRPPGIYQRLCEDGAIKYDSHRRVESHDESRARRSARISCFARSNSSPSSSSVIPLSRNF